MLESNSTDFTSYLRSIFIYGWNCDGDFEDQMCFYIALNKVELISKIPTAWNDTS